MTPSESQPKRRVYSCVRCFDLGCIQCFTETWSIASWWRKHPEEGATGYEQLVADDPSAWGHCSTGKPS